MSRTHAPLLGTRAALALCLATAACSAPTSDHSVGPAGPVALPPEVEEALTLTLDDLDVRHGSLRIGASMLDGSADVSLWLGPACAAREVGRGIATRSGFAWSLSSDELGRAIGCDLVVRAHGIAEDGTRVLKVAALHLSVSLVPVPNNAAQVRLVHQFTDRAETRMTFATACPARLLHVDGSVIGAEPEEGQRPRGIFIQRFGVANDDLARSMLHRRPISLQGEHFLATVTVGSLTLDVSEPVEETTVEVSTSEG